MFYFLGIFLRDHILKNDPKITRVLKKKSLVENKSLAWL